MMQEPIQRNQEIQQKATLAFILEESKPSDSTADAQPAAASQKMTHSASSTNENRPRACSSVCSGAMV